MSELTEAILNKMATHDHVAPLVWRELSRAERKKAAERTIELGLFRPRHGDGFHWIGQGYRNENLMFWHREKGILFPYEDIDDYGSVPPDFRVGNGKGTLSPTHWKTSVDHNSIIFLSDDLMKTIGESATPTKGGFTALVEIRKKSYRVLLRSLAWKGLPWASIDYDTNTLYVQGF